MAKIPVDRFKEFIVETIMENKDKKKKPTKGNSLEHLIDYTSQTNDRTCSFTLIFNEKVDESVIADLKMTSQILLSNMTAFNKDKMIKKYANPLEIISEY